MYFLIKKVINGHWPACEEGGIQLILQDPFSSLSHRFTVEDALLEPLKVNKIGFLKKDWTG